MENKQMSRLDIPAIDNIPASSREAIDSVGKRLGFVPNMHKLLSTSPAVLEAVSGLQNSLNKTLDAKTRNGIALAVSEVNGCNYCLGAHSYYASTLGKMSKEEIQLNRQGRSTDIKRQAAIRFAQQVTELRGKVSNVDLKDVRDAGFTDAQILEITALAVQFLLTNFINNVAETDVDAFPDDYTLGSVVVVDAD
jgi:uncharacterized peroxidase-related enzyme